MAFDFKKSTYLYGYLSKSFKITIEPRMTQLLFKKIHEFETYKEHIYALNSPYLGLYTMYFTDSDVEDIFDIFDIDLRTFSKTIDEYSSLIYVESQKKVDLNKMTVASNPFNILTIWLCHLILNSSLNSQTKEQSCMGLLKMLHYRFFTSLVNRRFQHKPNEDLMRATIESLSLKFDLVRYGTWKRVIEERCKDIMNPKESIHYETLQKFQFDQRVFYVITDTQSRIREKVNLVTSRFYEIRDEEQAIKVYGTVSTIDGEKIIKDTTNVLDNITTRLVVDIFSVSSFIDGTAIKILCGSNIELKPTMFRGVLNRFVDIANHQNKHKLLDEVKTIKGQEYIIGLRLLVTELINVTYRYCIQNGVNMKNRYDILRTAGNVYRNSQINNDDILLIKRSIGHFIESFPGTKRANTQTLLRNNLILYIVLLSFRYI